jgi:2-keto-4-pentenoate hydratase
MMLIIRSEDRWESSLPSRRAGSRTGIGLRAGEVISTGTVTGMLAAKAGEEHVADYGPFGEVRVRFGR